MKETARIVVTLSVLVLATHARAETLSIHSIQYTTDANGASLYDGDIVDCLGGVVIHKVEGRRPRLVIQDTSCGEGWCGIQVKDLFGSGAFTDVNIGDWVSFRNVFVEENKGTTFLQYILDNDPNFEIVSTDNPLPRPVTVTPDQIAAPVEGVDSWLVADHNAEKYESMLIRVQDAVIEATGYGKAYDNYVLQSNSDSNHICWASDYMNEDAEGIYHSLVTIGQSFCGVVGILEQYTSISDETDYDYYQLLTRNTGDFIIDQMADFDEDCDVDSADFGLFAIHWLREDCGEPDWCGGANMVDYGPEGTVGMADMSEFAWNWLAGK
ncbi:MAG: hypothetical protein JW720_04970 [Sedimentisphaerales bacterium]|nr:hypothetical protein [Sedimentisphaerales bacterium]